MQQQETPPTKAGWYWFEGVVIVNNEPIEVADYQHILDWHDGAMITRLRNGMIVLLHKTGIIHPLGDWRGRWVGPFVPRWER